MLFLAEASEAFRKIQTLPPAPAGLSSETSQIAYLISRCKHSKRWITNYKDRANIRINLAFHLSTQVDNELNLQISKATTALARDAQRDSASMITIAAVTMFFLPGTFISVSFHSLRRFPLVLTFVGYLQYDLLQLSTRPNYRPTAISSFGKMVVLSSGYYSSHSTCVYSVDHLAETSL